MTKAPLLSTAVCLATLATLPASAGEAKLEAELGYQGAAAAKSGDLEKSLAYVQPSLKYSWEATSGGADPSNTLIQLDASVRGWFDTQTYIAPSERTFGFGKSVDNWDYEASIRAASI